MGFFASPGLFLGSTQVTKLGARSCRAVCFGSSPLGSVTMVLSFCYGGRSWTATIPVNRTHARFLRETCMSLIVFKALYYLLVFRPDETKEVSQQHR